MEDLLVLMSVKWYKDYGIYLKYQGRWLNHLVEPAEMIYFEALRVGVDPFIELLADYCRAAIRPVTELGRSCFKKVLGYV